ncbi:TrmH family RNA methyltransferase [Aquimarina pacifica]|uniref:TrmH family RNA methyltransferase n=1 Tax=Aquimarina pacifica TaxID=1296415 RepID=UPI000471089C|nr:TrmH family RNA methyltransferase [Aquimarina pacifica]
MAEQLHHQNTEFIKKQFPITLVCDRVNSPANIGSLFRIADSFGIKQIYFCGEDITVISKRMQRTARATEKNMVYHQVDDSSIAIAQLKSEGYTILALEITDTSIPTSEYVLNPKEKIALVIGEENSGVSDQILELSKQHLHINMFGKNSSMNVATATAIALYEITSQYANHLITK